jgi:hypothetical protein
MQWEARVCTREQCRGASFAAAPAVSRAGGRVPPCDGNGEEDRGGGLS